MNVDLLVKMLGWASIINFSLLFLWFIIFMFAKDWIYKIYRKWFPISEEKMDIIHFCLMGVFELVTFAFFLAPYIALRIIL